MVGFAGPLVSGSADSWLANSADILPSGFAVLGGSADMLGGEAEAAAEASRRQLSRRRSRRSGGGECGGGGASGAD